MKSKQSLFDKINQVLLPLLTVGGYFLIAIKKPEIGLIIALFSQIFWFYTSYKAWKSAGQVGLMITTVIMSFIATYGVINYWFL